MDFNQSILHNRHRSSPHGRLSHILVRNLAIAALVGPVVLATQPATASIAKQSAPANGAKVLPANNKPPVQKIALRQSNVASETITGKADYHFRLLGYGLFLLHIGLIPLKLSKGHLIQVADGRSHR